MTLLTSGFFQQLTLAGQCFTGTAPIAGVDVPVSSGTTPVFMLWNPTGSGVNIVVNNLMISNIDATTPVVSGLAFGYTTGAGNSAATGSVVATFTAGTKTNCLIGGGLSSRVFFASASSGTTLTAATTTFIPVGLSHDSVTAGTGWQVVNQNFLGSLALAPGSLIHLVGSAAQTQNLMPSITWAEVPV
ncbi:MAG TPA: hypothetical protein VI358_18040 [Pseudolabrys sp.]